MHIVITRPLEDSLNLIKNFKKMGHIVTHIPLIKIKKLETKKINLINYKAVIFTSSNAIKFLNVEKFYAKINCYCVGNLTEQNARKAGFLNTYSSDGSVNSLKELIIRNSENKTEKFLYLSSEFISKNLDTELIKEGFLVDRISNYTSSFVEEISQSNLIFLKNNIPDVFLLYSIRSAKSLINLINKYSLLNIVTRSTLMCISEKVLLVLKEIKCKKKIIFNPGEEEFVLNKIE